MVSLYFVITTITTVEYGEYSAYQNGEIVFVMFLQLSGLAIYSNIMGAIMSIKIEKSAQDIINEKKGSIENFLN